MHYGDRQRPVDKAYPHQAVLIEESESYPLPENILLSVSDIKLIDAILDVKQMSIE